MPPGGQHRIVTLTDPQIRNRYTVDEQDEVLESAKIGCPGNNQASIILQRAEAEFDLATAPEWVCLQQSCMLWQP
jgi:hypothetical protein